MLPDAYVPVKDDKNIDSDSESRFLRLSKALEDGQSLLVRFCGNYRSGHSSFGYFYFDMGEAPDWKGRPHHSSSFPEDYEDRIGFSFEAKRKATAQGRELDVRRDERDVPKRFAALTAIVHRCPSDSKATQSFDEGKLMIVDFTQVNLLKMIDTLFAEEEYAIDDNQLANYVIKITRAVKKNKTSYEHMPLLKRVGKAEQALWDEQGGNKIYVPAIFTGADPFEGQPADGGDAPGQPPERAARRGEMGEDADWS